MKSEKQQRNELIAFKLKHRAELERQIQDEKTCLKCGERKPLKDFPRNYRNTLGVGSWCWECKGGKITPAKRQAMKKYASSEKGKKVKQQAKKKYANSEKGKKVIQQVKKKYANSEKGKEARKKAYEKWRLKCKKSVVNAEKKNL